MSKVSNAPLPEQTGSQTGMLSLSLADILVDEARNLRRFSTDEKGIAELAASIRSNGQIQPVVVEKSAPAVPGEDGVVIPLPPYTLVAGYNRIKALKLIATEDGVDSTVALATVRNGSGPDKNASLDAKLVNLDENLKRQDLSHMDLSVAITELRKDGMLDKDIAKRIGRSATFVSEVSKFSNLREKIQKGIHNGDIPFKLARELVKATEEEQDTMLTAAKAAKEAGENQTAAAASAAGTDKRKKRKSGKGKREDRAEKSGISSKQAILHLEQQKEALKGEEKLSKAEEKAAQVYAMLMKFLGGGMGMKAFHNRLVEMF